MTASEYFEQGRKMMDAGNLVVAMEFFQAAIEADMHFEKAYFLLAIAYEKQGEANKAKATLFSLLAVDPNNKKALSLLEKESYEEEKQSPNDKREEEQVFVPSPTPSNLLVPIAVPNKHRSSAAFFDIYLDFEGNRIYLNKIGDKVEVVAPNEKRNDLLYNMWEGYKEPEGKLLIPAYISYQGQRYNVSSINEEAFWRCESISAIVIPDTVTAIKSCAFACCTNLRLVTLSPSIVEIGYAAFSSCPITSITLPSSLKTIGRSAFEYSKLKHLVLPEGMISVDSTIVDYCDSLESLTIPSSVTQLTGFWGGINNDKFVLIMKGHPPVVSSMADGIKVEVPDGLLGEYRNTQYWQCCDLTEKQKRQTKKEAKTIGVIIGIIIGIIAVVTLMVISTW